MNKKEEDYEEHDKELTKNEKTISCPNCKKKFKINLEQEEIECECGEEFCAEEIIDFPEDFVWHPSEKY